jgi:hypothetical protein
MRKFTLFHVSMESVLPTHSGVPYGQWDCGIVGAGRVVGQPYRRAVRQANENRL